MITPLKDYINEAKTDPLQILLKDEKDWVMVTSKQYSAYISDKPELFEMIPYKELKLTQPEYIMVTFKKDGQQWRINIGWISKFDKHIYVCNGWKCSEPDINDLKVKIYEIFKHLSKSSAAREKFKSVMVNFINIINQHNDDPKHFFMTYREQFSTNSLEDLLKIK
jgi:hypothetical protein